jgi:hypothetical protein
MSFREMVRAYRMALPQLATELALAIIVIAILIGGIASGIFFSVKFAWNGTDVLVGGGVGGNSTYAFDPLSHTIFTYIFPLALAALLVGIVYHMYRGSQE